MPIAVACKACSAKFKAPDAAAGRRARCPKCGEPILIPAVTAPAKAAGNSDQVRAKSAAAPVAAPLPAVVASAAVVRASPEPAAQQSNTDRAERSFSAIALTAFSVASPVVRRTLSAVVRKSPSKSKAKIKPPLDDDFLSGPNDPRSTLPAVRETLPDTLTQPGQQASCPFCGESILAVAKKCKHCGETLDVALRANEETRRQVELLASQQNVGQAYPAPVNVHVNNVVSNTTIIGRDKRKGFSLLAGLLSFFIPGLGQLYRGRFFSALFWFIFTAAGYACFIIPGIVLHLLCVLSAAVRVALRAS